MSATVSPPLVIGGLGGSGTRVVADILLAQGWYLGQDLNRAKDNLLFTLLFKRPYWRKQLSNGVAPFQHHMELFERRTVHDGEVEAFFNEILRVRGNDFIPAGKPVLQ